MSSTATVLARPALKRPDLPRTPANIAGMSERLESLLRAGRCGAARSLLQALQRLQPPSPQLAMSEARLLVAEGRADAALGVLDQAIAEAPAVPALHRARAGVLVESDRVAEAVSAAAQALMLDPSDSAAKKMLGVLLVTLDRLPDAIACLKEALADDPRDASNYRGLAMAQERAGDAAGAEVTYELGLAACPTDIPLREAATMRAMRDQDFARAVTLAEAGRRLGRIEATGLVLLGHARASLGEHDAAAEAYCDAQKLAPDDAQIRHLALNSVAMTDGRRTRPERVRAMFDFYAEQFEHHILSLGYRIPGVVREALAAHLPPSAEPPPLLDLGCGTGLLAIAVADLVGPITGIDISPAMLARAAARGLYAELAEGDLLAWLAAETRQWRLIVAADVLIYFGALDEVLRGVRDRLAAGGLFLFSLEETTAADGWVRGRLGRHEHAAGYVADAVRRSGLELCRMAPEVQRHEAGTAVPGWLVTARRPA